MKKRTLTLVVALVLVSVIAVGGTLAWLTDKTETVTNTFTAGDVTIDLTETTGETYKMVPGNKIDKDPEVTVEAGSEACWLFVKVEEVNDVDTFLTYAIDSKWTQLDGVEGVYYIEVPALTAEDSEDLTYSVLAGDSVTVNGEKVTKEMLNALTETTYPQLKFTAYAVQKDSFATPALAWAEVSK